GASRQQLTTFPQTPRGSAYATARSDYPGGRQYLYSPPWGTLPSGRIYDNPRVWSAETGQTKAVTDTHAPLHVAGSPGIRWSTDGQDGFVSFSLGDDSTGRISFYRAWVSAEEITSPTYRPITLADLGTPRLEYVADSVGGAYCWSHDGSRIY